MWPEVGRLYRYVGSSARIHEHGDFCLVLWMDVPSWRTDRVYYVEYICLGGTVNEIYSAACSSWWDSWQEVA